MGSSGVAATVTGASASTGKPTTVSLPAKQPVLLKTVPNPSSTTQGESLIFLCCCMIMSICRQRADVLTSSWFPHPQVWRRLRVVQPRPTQGQLGAPGLPVSPALMAHVKARHPAARGCQTVHAVAAPTWSGRVTQSRAPTCPTPCCPLQAHLPLPGSAQPALPALPPPPEHPPVAGPSPPRSSTPAPSPLPPLAAPRLAAAAAAPTRRLPSMPTTLLVLATALRR